MLATYGLLSGEVLRLRLEDIQWHEERFRVRQSKTGVESFIPLMPAVGEALVENHQRGPAADRTPRSILGVRAPSAPPAGPASFATVIRRRLQESGIRSEGRHGAHAFRFARALSLLRASVSRSGSAICLDTVVRRQLRLIFGWQLRIFARSVSKCRGGRSNAGAGRKDRRLAGPVCEGSTCPDKSYELPLRLAEVPRFSWKERLEWSQPSALRRWLRAQLTDTPHRWVVHRAQLVTRFLDWLAEQKVIPLNPFAELRKRYECRSTAGIARALVSADPSKALEALRPQPRYGSHLGPVMRDHIQRMRSLGYHYGHESEFLRSTDSSRRGRTPLRNRSLNRSASMPLRPGRRP